MPMLASEMAGLTMTGHGSGDRGHGRSWTTKNSGAIPEVIGVPEAIFPHSDANALRQLLVKAIEDPPWRVALAKKQRQRVERNYSHEAVARSYTDFFLEMLELKQKNW